jgi:hypothetical protein
MSECPLRSPPIGGVTSSSQNPPFIKEKAPISKHMEVLERKILRVLWVPTGPEIKIGYAGEDQQ